MTEYLSDAIARRETSLAHHVSSLLRDVAAIAGGHAELAVVEARQATHRLFRGLVTTIAITIGAAVGWLGLTAAGVAWAVDAGASWPAALGIAAGLNFLLAVLLALWLRGQEHEPMFEATLRQIRRSFDADHEATHG